MTATAKKTTAKKAAAAPARKSTTSKPAATKSASAKPAPAKRASSKPAAPDNDEDADDASLDAFAKQVFTLIKNGIFDYCFTDLIDAVEGREKVMAQMVAEESKAKRRLPAKKTTTPAETEKVIPMPKRGASSFVPEVNGTYVIGEGAPPALVGAKVTFVKFYKGDDTKSAVKMVSDAPGAPVGKGVVVPTSSLKKPASRGRRPAKK